MSDYKRQQSGYSGKHTSEQLPEPGCKGAQVFYYKHSVEGKKLAEILQASFKENLDSENKRVEKADSTYYMLVHTSAPTVIAECGFLSNPTEASLLNSSEYQQKIAEALYKGIINYFCDEKHNN